jgi:hypothetical protein
MAHLGVHKTLEDNGIVPDVTSAPAWGHDRHLYPPVWTATTWPTSSRPLNPLVSASSQRRLLVPPGPPPSQPIRPMLGPLLTELQLAVLRRRHGRSGE